MNSMIKISVATAAFVATLGFGMQQSTAATLTSCVGPLGNDGQPVYDVTDNVSLSTLCFGLEGLSNGTDAKLTDLNSLEINGVLGGWTSLGKHEPFDMNASFSVSGDIVNGEISELSGTWKLFEAATKLYSEFMMVFKAGVDNNTDPASFVGYILSGTEGTWTSPHFGTNGNFRDLSNVELYARGEPGVIPLPAASWLLLSGLGGFVLLRRRRKDV